MECSSPHPLIAHLSTPLRVPVCVFLSCSIPEHTSGEILKAVQSIYPMQNVYIRKVKALKKPKFDSEFPSTVAVHEPHPLG